MTESFQLLTLLLHPVEEALGQVVARHQQPPAPGPLMLRQRFSNRCEPLGVPPQLLEPLLPPLLGFRQQLGGGVDHQQRQVVQQGIAGLLQAHPRRTVAATVTINHRKAAIPTLLQPLDEGRLALPNRQQVRQRLQDRC